MGTFIVKADIARNRLNWAADGFFPDEEFQAIVNQVLPEVDKLKPGFVVISNSPSFKPGSPKGVEAMKTIFEYLAKKGVKKMISVRTENAVAKMQLERTYKSGGISDHLFVSSLEEAAKLADTLQ